MKKSLISLLILGTLTACGGSSDGDAGSDTPSAPNAGAGPNGQGDNNPSQDNGNIKARFDACPSAITTVSGTSACLAGSYTGTDTRTQESCTVRIDANGSVNASRGATLSIQTSRPNSVQYAKYRTGNTGGDTGTTDSDSTRNADYLLTWSAGRTLNGTISTDTNLRYNQNRDGRLLIEVFYKNPLTGTTDGISCHMPV